MDYWDEIPLRFSAAVRCNMKVEIHVAIFLHVENHPLKQGHTIK